MTDEKTEFPKQHLEPSAAPSNRVLSEADKKYFDGKMHVGVAVEVRADGKLSHVMIPDAKGFTSGTDPIFITAPVRLNGARLKTYLQKKGIDFGTGANQKVGNLLGNLSIGCEALYLTTTPKQADQSSDTLTKEEADELNSAVAGRTPELTESTVVSSLSAEDKIRLKNIKEKSGSSPLLMMFEAKLEGGLIANLTDDPDLGALFDVNAVMVRVLRCRPGKGGADELIDYVNSLPEG